ncbi:hypothetical protein MPS_5295 [Mycobacterium pseudoshottsii JCM 15466]|nr:hypothetical protein MMSP_2570 [Mycobacterium sp. 012931]GAQ40649.1 hypothetical protein MPS_5295 [Mycobacterium pseudoshottsii JCM 15466]
MGFWEGVLSANFIVRIDRNSCRGNSKDRCGHYGCCDGGE